MPNVSMRQLLEAGVHFGHQTKRWNPKMKPYIYGARNGIYIIDLQKTVKLFRGACEYVKDLVGRGETILFVGTKKQARDAIEEEARRCGMFFVNNRWLGGTLTNFKAIRSSIDRLKRLEALKSEGKFELLPKKEVLRLEREMRKLEKSLGGIKDMGRHPGAVVVVDTRKERIAVHESNKLNIPVIGIVDTNSDPDGVDYIIPGNDDAIRGIKLFASIIADAVFEGKEIFEKVAQVEPGKKQVMASDRMEQFERGDVIVEVKQRKAAKPEEKEVAEVAEVDAEQETPLVETQQATVEPVAAQEAKVEV